MCYYDYFFKLQNYAFLFILRKNISHIFQHQKTCHSPLHATSSAPISDTPLTPLHATGIPKKSNSMKINQLHNQ